MRVHIAAAAALLLLAGCSQSDGKPIKRQPGSWSQKIDVTELSGPGVTDAQRAQMQQLMTMASAQPACITPELAAKEDFEKTMGRMGAQGNCTLAEKKVSGDRLTFVSNCKNQGKHVRVTADGTSSATAQDMRVTVETVDAGADSGKLVMKIATKRNGECTPGQFTPALPATAPTPGKVAS